VNLVSDKLGSRMVYPHV